MSFRDKLSVRHAVYFLAVGLATFFLIPPSNAKAAAPTTITQTFNESDAKYGNSVVLENGAKLIVFPGALSTSAEISFGPITDNLPALPGSSKLDGYVYQLNVTGIDNWSTGLSLINTIILPATVDTYYRQIWQYDLTDKKWVALTTKNYRSKKVVTAYAKSLKAYYAVLVDRRTQEGVASWYCKNHCSSKYPTLHGTSNNFAIGTYVNVTNLENKKVVRVKIISKWGEPAGRVIDLSWAAFAKIKGNNAGLARVRVTSISTTSVKTTPSASSSAPSVSAGSYTVYNESSKKVLASKKPNTVYPVASITKLVTAAVFLDTKTDLTKIFTYDSTQWPAALRQYAYLPDNVLKGGSLSARDALNALLIGSANAAGPQLVKISGLSYGSFIQRMNDKARAYGAKNTKLVDTHGLSARNLSTTDDLAKIASAILSDYSLIAKITSTRSYTITTRNDHVTSKVILNTDELLAGRSHAQGLAFASSLTFVGAKTGSTDAAKYTYVIRLKTSSGKYLTISLLGVPTERGRYNDAVILANWAQSRLK